MFLAESMKERTAINMVQERDDDERKIGEKIGEFRLRTA